MCMCVFVLSAVIHRSDTQFIPPIPQVSPSHPFLKPSQLREDAGTAMGSMLALTASPTVSRSASPHYNGHHLCLVMYTTESSLVAMALGLHCMTVLYRTSLHDCAIYASFVNM